MTVHAGDPSDGSALRLVHDELVRIEAHWTMQVQNQQTRIFAVLTVNGFALAFLATAGFLSSRHGDAFDLFCVSLLALTLALIVGIMSLVPRIAIGGHTPPSDPQSPERPVTTEDVDARAMFEPDERWLDARWVWEEFRREHGDEGPKWLVEVCRTLASNRQGNRAHADAMARRRTFLHYEIALIVAALVVLLPAVALLIPSVAKL
jgi:hypothetical protein